MEIELKLSIDPADVAAFMRHPLLALYATEAPQRQLLRNTYFDTPDAYLQRHACGLRVRKHGRTLVQTLKGGGSVEGGLHQRHEWESALTQARPDLALLRQLVGKGHWAEVLADPQLEQQLAPAFSTDFERISWQLRSRFGDQVELALDRGRIAHGRLSVPISEIELELKSGDPACLFELAQALAGAVPLRLGNASKAQRGYQLLLPQPVQVQHAQLLSLPRAMSAGQALSAIVANCVQQIQGNEEALSAGEDPEAVHQMRVGVRRLRSALGLFARHLPLPPGLDEELRWLAATLGAARQWDVLAAETLPALERAYPEQAARLVPLRQALLAQAASQRAKAVQDVASPRYTLLLLALGRWVHAEAQTLSMPVAGLASGMLRRYQKRLQRRAELVRGDDPTGRHRMRIAGKKLRYALDFFRALYPQRQIKPYIGQLGKLQDCLGHLNDVAVAINLLSAPALQRSACAFGAGFVCDYLVKSAEREAAALPRRWRRLKQIRFSP